MEEALERDREASWRLRTPSRDGCRRRSATIACYVPDYRRRMRDGGGGAGAALIAQAARCRSR